MKVFHYQYCVAVGEKGTVASSPDHFDRKNTKLSINTYITKISHNFLVCKFCGNAQFPQSFWEFVRICTETGNKHYH